ncbi:hypothetical protein LCGC14_0442090 [marine sediment metagenome]|uniref:Uncharacterized protein n=1 Tax=marine sediment metagenome TaxID=412755 RepID=A0A0F9SR46_9ZZZZ
MFSTSSVRREEAINKLKEIFSEHVGRSNPISSENLFLKVIGENPDDLDFYDRAYKWNAIKRILSVLRKSGELFVIMGTSHHYVLNDEDELDAYKNRVDATIKGLHAMKQKAEVWIKSEKLKELKEKKKKKEKKALKAVAQ